MIGVVVTPDAPLYHWKVGVVPEAATVNVAAPPLLIVVETGAVVIAGGVMTGGGALTVAVTVPESATPAAFVARTQ
ncbi:MAG: hypothetical protein Q8Q59_02245 [Luteolibacter sp.]|nr:hypothetical protein [Luteolibacter sp.]